MKAKVNDIIKSLKADLTAAETLRKELDGKIAIWKKEYNGELYGNEDPNRSKIISRDIKKQAEWQHASIIDPFVSTPDIIKCLPITYEDRDAAIQNELVLNTQFCRLFNRYNFISKVAKILAQEGTCIVMTGWEYEEREEEVEVPIVEVDPYTGQEVIVGMTKEVQTITVKNNPTAKVCRGEDVYTDPTCQDDPDNAQFFIYRYESDISTLKQDGRYKNLDKIVINTDDYDYDPEDKTVFKFSDEPRKKIVVYEYWGNYDVDGDDIAEPIVCTWVGDVVIRLQENPYPDRKPPFIVIPFNSVPFQLHGEPDGEIISSNQKVKTAIYRGILDNMANSNNAQKGIKKGALDTVNRGRFFRGENFEFNGSPNDFWDGSYNQLPGSVFDVVSLMNNEIESLTGVKSFNQGISGSSLGGTATGARGALDATAARRLNTVRNIAENLVKPLMRKWISYNSEFLDEEFVIRITNDEFIPVRRDDLSGKIDIDIAVSTSEDNAAKAQELAFMLQTIGPSEDPSIRKIIMSEIARLQKMPDLAKKIEEYQPQPDPIQQEIQQLQLELLKAQVQNEYAKAKENEVDVQLKSWKSEVEKAKARNLDSKSDIQDLDFLKNESGASLQEELVKKDADNSNKLDLELLKKIHNP